MLNASETRSFVLERLEQRTMLTGSGYEDRGWVSVIVDYTLMEDINVHLDQFKQDLIGDGWRVSMHDNAPRMDDENYVWHNELSPIGPVTLEVDEIYEKLDDYKNEIATVKGMIADDAAAAITAGSQLKQVIIVGHVTVPYSGLRPYDGHWFRAFPTDLYYADLDGTPQTWGDYFYHGVNQSNNDVSNELTTNEIGDGRFDADAVPGDAQTITLTGVGQFKLNVLGQSTADWIPYNPAENIVPSVQDIRNALNLIENLAQNGGPDNSFVTVTQSSNVYTIRILGALTADPPAITATTDGMTVNVQSIDNGGIEVGIGRIDMGNLDSAFPDVYETSATQFESDLINQYLQRDHDWRMGLGHNEDGLIDPKSDIFVWGPLLEDQLELVVGNAQEHVNHAPWLSQFSGNPAHYLFATVADSGFYDLIAGFGDPNHDPPINFPTMTSYHFAATPVFGVFNSVYGSYMGDWNSRSLRAVGWQHEFTDEVGNTPIFPFDPDHPIKASIVRSVLASPGD